MRISPRPLIVECPDGRGSPVEIRRREAITLLGAVPADALAVGLDRTGLTLSSLEFASRLDAWLAGGRPVVFLIGGAEGFDPSVRARAATLVSFGPQTWPHLLARVMLLEQLWRARSISAGHPYHRA